MILNIQLLLGLDGLLGILESNHCRSSLSVFLYLLTELRGREGWCRCCPTSVCIRAAGAPLSHRSSPLAHRRLVIPSRLVVLLLLKVRRVGRVLELGLCLRRLDVSLAGQGRWVRL